MKKLKIYLDTSAIGYLDENTSPREMADMLALWEKIKQNEFDVVISDITLEEINRNRNPDKVHVLNEFLSEISFDRVVANAEAGRVADLVKINGMLTSDKHLNDRLHIGCAVVCGAEILVSLNFKHLVNVKTIKGVRGIAISEGYGYIEIMTPAMMINGGE